MDEDLETQTLIYNLSEAMCIFMEAAFVDIDNPTCNEYRGLLLEVAFRLDCPPEILMEVLEKLSD